ncbi:metal-dependent hydrolase [bacterium]|nr:metal-dependent hydrolase [bacterium]
MNFPSHLKAGLIASAAVTISARTITGTDKLESLAMIFLLCLVGSLAPDLDTKSVPHKIAALFGFMFCIASIYTGHPYPAPYFATGFLFISSMDHRGYTHVYLWPLILIGAGLYGMNLYLISFGVGLLTHYALDRMNPLKLNNWLKPIRL